MLTSKLICPKCNHSLFRIQLTDNLENNVTIKCSYCKKLVGITSSYCIKTNGVENAKNTD